MRLEIISAADFLVQLLRLQASALTEVQLQSFKGSLTEVLRRRYHDHWFPDKPNRGSGYRCIRINGKMDPVIAQAGMKVGLLPTTLHNLFPSELTMWIDPREVSYRIGENGSICVLFEGSEQSQHDSAASFALPPLTINEATINKFSQGPPFLHHHQHHQQQSQQRQQQQHSPPPRVQHQQQQQHHHHLLHHNVQRNGSNNNHSNHHQSNYSMPVQHHLHNHQQQSQFESCKDSLLMEHTQFSEQIAAYVSS